MAIGLRRLICFEPRLPDSFRSLRSRVIPNAVQRSSFTNDVIPNTVPSRACAVRAREGYGFVPPTVGALRRPEPRSLDNLSSRSRKERLLGMTP
jgi:hypothetical protein